METLEKKCPRCGKASANSSNPSGRCPSCLKKLKANKKKPGHWQRAQTKFDDAKRREKGKNGTASKKSKGLASSRKKFVSKFKNDEKKSGEKLSPDRINNERGYESKNVRNIKESLNRGRHKVDQKKLSAWRKKMKKSNIQPEDLLTLLRAYALNKGNDELAKALEINGLELIKSILESE